MAASRKSPANAAEQKKINSQQFREHFLCVNISSSPTLGESHLGHHAVLKWSSPFQTSRNGLAKSIHNVVLQL